MKPKNIFILNILNILNILISSLFPSLMIFSAAQAATPSLRVKNDFKMPEEVIRYYCARDAEGFIWSGLSDPERLAFTLWTTAPEPDSFLIARSYQVLPAKIEGETAQVEVRYQIIALSDAHGTRMPAPDPKLSVTFVLKKANGSWRIIKPAPNQIFPVLKGPLQIFPIK